MSRGRAPAVVGLCTLLTFACGSTSTYVPREPNRIHPAKTGMGRSLDKNGQLYSMSSLSMDPLRIVAGDPAAEEHARIFIGRTRMAEGLLVLGVALLVPTAALAADNPAPGGPRAVMVAFASASMASFLAALMLPRLSRHHLYDAINVYNDNLSMRPDAGTER